MSQYWDAQAGAVYQDPDYSAYPAADYGGGSGFLQAVTALGTGYLSRRLDIDLQQRAIGNQPAVTVNGTGPRVGLGNILNGGTAPDGSGSMGLLTLAALGIGAYLLIKG